MKKTKITRKLSKQAPSILTGIGIGGMWLTAILLAKAAPKIKERIEAKEAEKNEGNDIFEEDGSYIPVALKEKVFITLSTTWPTLVLGGMSTYCIFTANRVNIRRNAALASAYYISQNALQEYQAKVIEHIGEKKALKVKDDIAQDRLNNNPPKDNNIIITGLGDHWCCLLPFNTYFKSDIEKVKQAVLTINERLINGNELYVSLNDFLAELNIPAMPIGDNLGWNIEDGIISVSFSSALMVAPDQQRVPCLTVDFDIRPI